MSSTDYTHDNNTELSRQLEDLLEHNQAMLKDAQQGQWDKVIEAEVLRNTLLKNMYSSNGIEDTPGIRLATMEMLSINQQLELLATAAKKTAATDALSINKGRNAVSAYSQHKR